MNSNFNGGIIDTTSTMIIINKINLFIENEEKIIQDIENSLSALSDGYSSDNSKVIDGKINNLCLALSSMLDNRKRYVEIIRSTVERYVSQNEHVTSTFNNL